MESIYGKKARELFTEGYNCAQAVMLAFLDETGMDEKTAAALCASFGGGMGRLREVCGAVSGMFMVAGLKYGYTEASDKEGKTAHYALIQELAKKFEAENGSIVCREILKKKEKRDIPVPDERTKEYYAVRPCERLVGFAADMVYELIKSRSEGK